MSVYFNMFKISSGYDVQHRSPTFTNDGELSSAEPDLSQRTPKRRPKRRSVNLALWNLRSIAWKSCRIEVFPTIIRMGNS